MRHGAVSAPSSGVDLLHPATAMARMLLPLCRLSPPRPDDGRVEPAAA
jgi:hypothetical protein